jgi:methyl-accepting chemotaxis protein
MIKNMSLKAKLAAGFGTLLVLLAALAVISYNSVGQLADISDRVLLTADKKELTEGIDIAVEKQTTGVRGFLLAGKEDLLKHDEDGKRELKENMDKLEKLLVTEEGKKLFAEMSRRISEFRAIADKEIQLRRAGKVKDAAELAFNPRTAEVRTDLRKAVTDLLELQEKLKQEALTEQAAVENKVRILVLTLSAIAMFIGILMAVLIVRSITGAMGRMLGLIQEIAANNLAVQDMQITSQDEIGKAAAALNGMKNNLRGMIQSIAGTAEHVASASEEISSSATQQAQGAETQKDQTTQVATAMQEMSSTVLQVSENSNKAADSARKASETARQGGRIVDETLNKMRSIADSVGATAKKVEELGKSSDQIGRIIGVIDDIADQTNLLALNAAIEAARAGEQGRGFAVVADEVRKLAERTTTATKEIAQMIKNIQDETKVAVQAMEQGTKQVEEGVQTTSHAGDSLKEIIQVAEEVGEMITHIATAATEQSSASEQVNNNMEQIAKLVQESAVGAQQSAKACQDLSGLAFDLQKLVGTFKLDNSNNSFAGDTTRRHGSAAAVDPESTRAMKTFAAGAGR